MEKIWRNIRYVFAWLVLACCVHVMYAQDAPAASDSLRYPISKNYAESHDLSERERDVLVLVAKGYTNKEIATELFISPHTVISHRKNIVHKTGIRSVAGLTVYAVLNKLIDSEML